MGAVSRRHEEPGISPAGIFFDIGIRKVFPGKPHLSFDYALLCFIQQLFRNSRLAGYGKNYQEQDC
jgi:hypothetical protein